MTIFDIHVNFSILNTDRSYLHTMYQRQDYHHASKCKKPHFDIFIYKRVVFIMRKWLKHIFLAYLWPLTWPHDLVHRWVYLRNDFSGSPKDTLSKNINQTPGHFMQLNHPGLLDYYIREPNRPLGLILQPVKNLVSI